MFRDLKPYDAYRASGTPWLPSVPLHWQSPRLKTVLAEKNVRGFPGEPLLAATQSRGVIRKSDYATRTVTAQKDLDLLKLVEVGDFVISLRSFQGGIERAYARGIISPAYTILEARDPADSAYLTLLFKSRPFVDALTLTVTGIREGQNIEYPRLARDLLPLPSRKEQAAIVKYLGHAHARIDRAIAAKRTLIALLEEQKQAIINRAVTRGLDPTVPMKDSGIPWIGRIPEHWSTVPLKRAAASSGGMTPGRDQSRYWSGDVPWVTPKDMKVRHVVSSIDHVSSAALSETSLSVVAPGAVLMVVRGMILARKVPVAVNQIPVTINQDMKALRPKEGVECEYLLRALEGMQPGLLAITSESGHGTKRLDSESWERFDIALPPVEEQLEICEDIDHRLMAADEVARQARSEIDLMREFRARLTSDVVTGQLDVRETAAALPDLVEPVPVDPDSDGDESFEDLDDVLEEVDA